MSHVYTGIWVVEVDKPPQYGALTDVLPRTYRDHWMFVKSVPCHSSMDVGYESFNLHYERHEHHMNYSPQQTFFE